MKVCCEDCGSLYGDGDWLDTFLSNEQWKLISGRPDEGGILCAGCLVKRAARLKNDDGKPIFSVCKMIFE